LNFDNNSSSRFGLDGKVAEAKKGDPNEPFYVVFSPFLFVLLYQPLVYSFG
jgi:hypothetical protein